MFPKLTPAVRAIILVNVLVWLLEKLAATHAHVGYDITSNLMLAHFALWPLAPQGEEPFRVWQLVTYAFLHDPADIWHIIFNMFALYVFGPPLEQYWGARRFIPYYFVCVIAAGATQLAMDYAFQTPEATIGASGGIFGILLAFALLFPRARLLLYFAIPVPAWLFVAGYAVLELFFGVTGRQASVAHFAHLGGMAGGAIMMLYWRLRSDRGGWRPS